jgi:hypothetical protein
MLVSPGLLLVRADHKECYSRDAYVKLQAASLLLPVHMEEASAYAYPGSTRCCSTVQCTAQAPPSKLLQAVLCAPFAAQTR